MSPLDSGVTGESQTDATSVDEELRAAFQSASADTPAAAAPQVAETEAAPTPAVALPTTQPAQATTPAQTEAPATAEKPDAPAATALEPIEAPAHWRAEDREMFSKQTPEAQRFLMNRDRETAAVVTRKTQELAERGRGYDEIERVLSPRMQNFARQGMTPGQVMTQLFALSDFAETDPAGFVRYFAQQRGIDLAAISAPPRPADPRDVQFSQLQQRLNQIEAEKISQQQQEAQARQAALSTEISDFQAAKDATGAPLYPHFEAVKAEMAALLGAGRADSLKTAYDMAVWANPQAREAELSRMERVKQAERDRAERERAAKARVAGSSITGQPVGAGAVPTFDNVESELRYHFTAGAGRL